MRSVRESAPRTRTIAIALLLVTFATGTLQAKEWQAWVGTQSRDMGSQALAFLPNELWIHTNDSIRWTLASTEIHTVTFLIPPPAGRQGAWGRYDNHYSVRIRGADRVSRDHARWRQLRWFQLLEFGRDGNL